MNPKAKELTFEDISVGDSIEFEVSASKELADKFADLSGDYNPLHMNEEYARATKFNGRIIHGMAIASFFSRLVGMHLPGKYCLYLSQEINFKKPVMIGDIITIRGEVVDKVNSFKMLTINTQALNNNLVLIEGKAKVMVMG